MSGRARFCCGSILVLVLSLLSITMSASPAQAVRRDFPNGWVSPLSPARQFEDWGFGSCNPPYYQDQAHLGADSQGASAGDGVFAMGPGTIVRIVGSNWGPGGAVGVEHVAGDGSRFLAVYGHVVNISVGVGNTVSAGQQIAALYNWGDNSHLHLGVKPLAPGESADQTLWGNEDCTSSAPAPTHGFVDPVPWLAAHPSGPPPNPDADGDGVNDSADKCPSLRGSRIWLGCRGNLLRNASLEEGSTAGWGVLGPGTTNVAAYNDPAEARDHQWFGQTNVSQASGSIYQDVSVAPAPGESYTFSLWVRSATATPVDLNIVLWAVGGNQQTGEQRVTLGHGWRLVSVTLDVREGGHPHLRAQMYIATPGTNIDFDGAQLQRNLLRNGSLEEGSAVGWGVLGPGTTNVAAYNDAARAKDQGWYGETNVSEPGGSIYQDIAIAPQQGESYAFSLWVRSKTTAPVQLNIVLWAAGGNQQSGGRRIAVGRTWRFVSVPLDVREGGHGHLRAQVYVDTPGRSVNFDGASVIPTGLRNASLEEGSTVGWGVLGPGTTNIAAYKNAASSKDHEWYGETNVSEASGSIYQDIPIAPQPGESYNFSMWVRSATNTSVDLELVLWAVGGNQQKGARHVTVGHTWRLVSVPLDVREGGHGFLRAQLYVHTPGKNINFDGAQLAPRSDQWDTDAPTVTPGPLPAFRLSGSAAVSWTATDAMSGTATSDVRWRRATASGALGAWQYPSGWQRVNGRTVTMTGMQAGHTYCFSVRSRDRDGNLSGWTPDQCTSVAFDDRALTGARWTRGTGSAYYSGTFKSTERRGRSLSTDDVRVARIAVVATRCSRCGIVGVFVDGVRVGRINLYARTRKNKQVVVLPRIAYRVGTVTLRALSDGKLVLIDGLGVSRS